MFACAETLRNWVQSRADLRGVAEPPTLEKFSTTLKKLLDRTFSAFRIAISGTSTVSACRFLETI